MARLGGLPELIEPGKPQQNGRPERMYRTLKAETTRPPAASQGAQQRKFNRFRETFNLESPHEALDIQPPHRAIGPRRGQCLSARRRLNTPTASKCAT